MRRAAIVIAVLAAIGPAPAAHAAAKSGGALVPYLLDGVAGDPSLNLPDGIHPNADGQRILAENVWHVLEPIARETAAEPSSHVR